MEPRVSSISGLKTATENSRKQNSMVLIRISRLLMSLITNTCAGEILMTLHKTGHGYLTLESAITTYR